MLVKITAISIIRPENNQNEHEKCFVCSEVHPNLVWFVSFRWCEIPHVYLSHNICKYFLNFASFSSNINRQTTHISWLFYFIIQFSLNLFPMMSARTLITLIWDYGDNEVVLEEDGRVGGNLNQVGSSRSLCS